MRLSKAPGDMKHFSFISDFINEKLGECGVSAFSFNGNKRDIVQHDGDSVCQIDAPGQIRSSPSIRTLSLTRLPTSTLTTRTSSLSSLRRSCEGEEEWRLQFGVSGQHRHKFVGVSSGCCRLSTWICRLRHALHQSLTDGRLDGTCRTFLRRDPHAAPFPSLNDKHRLPFPIHNTTLTMVWRRSHTLASSCCSTMPLFKNATTPPYRPRDGRQQPHQIGQRRHTAAVPQCQLVYCLNDLPERHDCHTDTAQQDDHR